MNDELIESGIAWIGNHPNNWKVGKVKLYCQRVVGGGTPKSSVSEYFDDGDIIWVTPSDFTIYKSRKYIADSNRKLTKAGLIDSSSPMLPVGSVLMSSRASIGEAKIASGELCTNQGFVNFIPSSRLHGEYLYYIINGYLGSYFNKIASGSTFNEISRRQVKDEKVPLPPKPEQEAIARHLDTVTARIDEAIAIKQQQVAKLEQTRVSLINEVIKNGVNQFVKFKKVSREPITSIPEHYKVVKLKSVTRQIVDGTHFTPNYLEGDTSEGIPFLRITDLQNKDIDLTSTKYISPEEHKELSKRCLPEKGDLLLSKNGTIGLTKIVDWEYECSLFVSICLIKPLNQLLDIEYLNYYFQSDYMAYQFYHESKQITVSNLHLENIRDFLIVLPPLNEQRQLAQVLRDKEEQFHRLRTNLTKQIAVLRAYRRSVIHEFVTGKKRVAMAQPAVNQE